MAFTPFMQGSQAQNIINQYLNTPIKTDINSAGNFRNPEFDLRTEQGLSDDALYPNPLIDFSAEEETADPCPEGYMLVDGVCQPIETFGQSMYEPNKDDNNNVEERPYMSIEDMKNANDFELLNYLNDGWLKGNPYDISIGGGFLPLSFSLPFGKQNKMRKDFIISELAKRGYDIDSQQGQQSLGQALNIIGNAQASNQGVMPNQISYFTPDEINYQIQQSNNPNQGNYQAPQMTETQVIDDAQQSGGSVNQFEAQNINAGNQNTGTPVSYASLNPNDGILYTAPSNSPHGNIGQQVREKRLKEGYDSNPNNLMFGK